MGYRRGFPVAKAGLLAGIVAGLTVLFLCLHSSDSASKLPEQDSKPSVSVEFGDLQTWMQGIRDKARVRFVPTPVAASDEDAGRVLGTIDDSLGELTSLERGAVLTHLERAANRLLSRLERRWRQSSNDLTSQLALADLQLVYEQYIAAISCLNINRYYLVKEGKLLGLPGVQTVIIPTRVASGSADTVFVLDESSFPQLKQMKQYREAIALEIAKDVAERFNSMSFAERADLIQVMLNPPDNDDARRRSSRLRKEYLLRGLGVDSNSMRLVIETGAVR